MMVVTGLIFAISKEHSNRVNSFYGGTGAGYLRPGNAAGALASRNAQRQANLQGFLLTGKTAYLSAYDEDTRSIRALVKQMSGLIPEDRNYGVLIEYHAHLLGQWEEKIADTGKGLRRQMDDGLIGPGAYAASIARIDGEGRSILEELKRVELQLQGLAEKEIVSRAHMAVITGERTRNFLIAVGIIAVLGSLFFGLSLSGRAVSALNGAGHTALFQPGTCALRQTPWGAGLVWLASPSACPTEKKVIIQ
jgi:CHASE3 domain sensor protein